MAGQLINNQTMDPPLYSKGDPDTERLWREVDPRTPITGSLDGSAGGCGNKTGKILSVREVNERDGGISSDGNRRYRRTFHVITGGGMVSAKTVLRAQGIPQIGEKYRFTEFDGTVVEDNQVCVIDKTVAMVDKESVLLWVVDVIYDTAGTPVALPPEVSWGGMEQTRAIDREWTSETSNTNPRPGYHGRLITNSAGDPFDPPIEIEENRAELTISRHEYFFSFRRAVRYRNAINTDYVSISGDLFDPFELKIASISAKRVAVGPGHYWYVTYVVQFREGGWKRPILDRGFRRLKNPADPNSAKETIYDRISGAALAKPALLNGQGQELQPGQAPVFLPFRLFPEYPFAPLLLDYNRDEFNDEVLENYVGN